MRHLNVLRAFKTDRGRARLLLAVFIVFGVALTVWVSRQSYLVHRLTRGVGDTWFHTADGRRWFRLDEQRQDVPIAAIAPHLQQAFVAVEDHRFYMHPGLDPIALGRAVWRNVREPGTVEGGSTLTQQLARTLFLSNRKSYVRKVREAVLSVLIETQLSKQQILELYLNRIYLSAGTYGVEAMSRRVFGKAAKDLSLAESALIAGLARAPATLSPWSNLDGAVARSHTVLARMRQEGFITEAQEQQARRAPLRVQPYRSASERRYGYAKDYLRQRFRDRFGGDHPPDWRVETTFVAALQDAAETAVENGLRRRGADLQAALVAIDPATGDVLALVGGRDYERSAFNRASRSRRQPGSAFKPFVFAAALERGFSPVSVLSGLDALPPQGHEEWTPRNVHDDAADTMTVRAALVESNNRAATFLQQRVGSRAVLGLAGNAGLRDLPDVPSLALGTGLVTPLETDGGVLRVSQRRAGRPPARPGSRRRCRRQYRTGDDAGNGARPLARGVVPDGVDAERRGRARDRHRGETTGCAGASGRQDRHDRRLQGRVVRRLLVVDGRRRVGGLRSAADDRVRRIRRPRGAPDLGRLHAPERSSAPGGGVRAAGWSPGRTVVRRVVSETGGRMPALHRVPQRGRPRARASVYAAPREHPAAARAYDSRVGRPRSGAASATFSARPRKGVGSISRFCVHPYAET